MESLRNQLCQYICVLFAHSMTSLREQIVRYMNEVDLYILLPENGGRSFWPELLQIACDAQNPTAIAPITRRIVVETCLKEIASICDCDMIESAINMAFEARRNGIVTFTVARLVTSLIDGVCRRPVQLLTTTRAIFLVNLLDLCVEQVENVKRLENDKRISRSGLITEKSQWRDYGKILTINFMSLALHLIHDILAPSDSRIASAEDLATIVNVLVRSVGNDQTDTKSRHVMSIIKSSSILSLWDANRADELVDTLRLLDVFDDGSAWTLYTSIVEASERKREVCRIETKRQAEFLRLEMQKVELEAQRLKDLVRTYRQSILPGEIVTKRMSHRLVTIKGIETNSLLR